MIINKIITPLIVNEPLEFLRNSDIIYTRIIIESKIGAKDGKYFFDIDKYYIGSSFAGN